MSEWISVKKKRPHVQRGSRYYGSSGPAEQGCAFLPVLFCSRAEVCAGRFFGRRLGYWSLQGVRFPDRYVDHWMPMPTAPK